MPQKPKKWRLIFLMPLFLIPALVISFHSTSIEWTKEIQNETEVEYMQSSTDEISSPSFDRSPLEIRHLKGSYLNPSENRTTHVSVIFSSLYGLRQEGQTIQVSQERWAVQSWALFGRKIQPSRPPLIVGFVDDDRFCDSWLQENVVDFHCETLNCPDNDLDIPTIPCIYQAAGKYAVPGTIVAYVNGDIVFPESMANVIHASTSKFGQNVQVVGQRVNIEPPYWLSPNSRLESRLSKLEAYATRTGVPYSEWGIDYFFFPAKYIFDPFPPFYVGRWRWDNAMLLTMLLRDIPTIDGTEIARVIHFGLDENDQGARIGATENSYLASAEFGFLFYLGRISNVPHVAKWNSNQTLFFDRIPRDQAILMAIRRDVNIYDSFKALGGP